MAEGSHPFHGQDKLVNRVLSNPDLFPDEFKNWLTRFIQNDPSLAIPLSAMPRIKNIQVAENAAIHHSKLDLAGDPSLAALWPVGSVFISVVSTNPATLLGFGTWAAFATGRTLVGIDAGQTEFDTVEETGGAKTHALVISEIPAHDHDVGELVIGSEAAHTHGASGLTTEITGIHDHGPGTFVARASIVSNTAATGSADRVNALVDSGGDDTGQITGTSATAGNHSHLVEGNTAAGSSHTHSITGSTADRGGSGAHNNLQPYIVVYMWKRTA